MLGKVRTATANDGSDVWLGLIGFVCFHVRHLRCFFLSKEKTTEWQGRVSAEGTFSRPLDKSLGREADPEGGKIYDKGSACPRSRGTGDEGKSRSKGLDGFQGWPEGTEEEAT